MPLDCVKLKQKPVQTSGIGFFKWKCFWAKGLTLWLKCLPWQAQGHGFDLQYPNTFVFILYIIDNLPFIFVYIKIQAIEDIFSQYMPMCGYSV